MNVVAIGSTCTVSVLEQLSQLHTNRGKLGYLSEHANQNDAEVDNLISQFSNSVQIPNIITIRHQKLHPEGPQNLPLEVSIRVSGEDREYFFFRQQIVFRHFYEHKGQPIQEWKEGLPDQVQIEYRPLQNQASHPEANYVVHLEETKEVIQDLDLNVRIDDLKEKISDLQQELAEFVNLKTPKATTVAPAVQNLAGPNQQAQPQPQITFEQFKVDMDQVLLYQFKLQEINEKLETFQLNEDVDADNV